TATVWTSSFDDGTGWQSDHFWVSLSFPDVNGDGKADICGRGSQGIYCGLSNGATGFSNPTLWLAEMGDDKGWAGSPSYWGTVQFPDINADGKADVCGRSGTGIMCALSN